MYDEQIDYERIRARVEQRVKRRAKFYKHLISYISVNIFLWLMWGFPALWRGDFSWRGDGIPWPFFVTLFWGIGLVQDGFRAFFEFNSEAAFEREMEREVERERRRVYGDDDYLSNKPKRSDDKPKREQTVRLSDDGELIYEDEDLRSGTRSPGQREN